jgi:hypothetical protein
MTVAILAQIVTIRKSGSIHRVAYLDRHSACQALQSWQALAKSRQMEAGGLGFPSSFP